jgi:hypothetical protein
MKRLFTGAQDRFDNCLIRGCNICPVVGEYQCAGAYLRPTGIGGVALGCGDYFHVLREHFQQNVTGEDRTNVLQCVSKIQCLRSREPWQLDGGWLL